CVCVCLNDVCVCVCLNDVCVCVCLNDVCVCVCLYDVCVCVCVYMVCVCMQTCVYMFMLCLCVGEGCVGIDVYLHESDSRSPEKARQSCRKSPAITTTLSLSLIKNTHTLVGTYTHTNKLT